ncbi:hypothetical protein [Brucella anthropi]|uniref:hypothetical protein n=1 Tax=Brucella anthropi TaxID=529 RepID=UPI003D969528
MKLTEKQTETLGLIADGKVYQRKFGYGAWRIQGAHPTVVGKLISMKLAAWDAYKDNWDVLCSITEAGRQALKGGDA